MKKFLLIMHIAFISCSAINNNTSISDTEPPKIITLDPTRQAEYANEWAKLVSNYPYENRLTGFADVWGGGKIEMSFWFDDEGHLWDQFKTYDGSSSERYILHPLTTKGGKQMAFINGHTAVVYMPYSASYTLAGSMYVLQFKDGKLYRTEDAWGFKLNGKYVHMNSWDGKTVNISGLFEMAEVDPKNAGSITYRSSLEPYLYHENSSRPYVVHVKGDNFETNYTLEELNSYELHDTYVRISYYVKLNIHSEVIPFNSVDFQYDQNGLISYTNPKNPYPTKISMLMVTPGRPQWMWPVEDFTAKTYLQILKTPVYIPPIK